MLKHLLLIPLLVLQFTAVDREFHDAKYASCEKALQQMLPQAGTGAEKAEVLWRLSRVALLQGDAATDVQAKRAHYTRGIEYAEKAIAEDPSNSEGYMWHSGNVGRDCLTRSLPEQAKASGTVQKDLTIILNRLNKASHSAAWHALAELYWKHPLKSKDSAVNFGRRAVACIPEEEVRLMSCLLLADMLYQRNLSAEKRGKEAARSRSGFASAKNNIDKYACYDGSSARMPWMDGPLGGMSDREEAAAVIRYAKARYAACKDLFQAEKAEYNNLQNWSKTHP